MKSNMDMFARMGNPWSCTKDHEPLGPYENPNADRQDIDTSIMEAKASLFGRESRRCISRSANHAKLTNLFRKAKQQTVYRKDVSGHGPDHERS